MSGSNTPTRTFSSLRLVERLPYLIMGFGAALGLVLLLEVALIPIQGPPNFNGYYAGIVSSVLFIGGLAFGGRWIKRSNIPPERYERIGYWMVAATISFTVFILVITFTAVDVSKLEIISTTRWAASIGAGLGLVIGVFDARAVQQAFRAGVVKQRELEVRQERDRLEEFANVVSHDLRNPLNVARGRLELAAQDCDNEHIDAVEDAHERMETLIEDMLSLARAGEAIGETRPVSLSEVVEMGWRHVDAPAAQVVAETDRIILADESRLQQLLENLFRNAIEHGGEGVTVTVGDLPDGFYVEDDGPGIPEDVRDRILDPGYSTSEGGTGFGLSIVRDIASAHGWEVTVTSGTEGGARFEFTGVQSP